MPSIPHEALVAVLSDNPQLIVELLHRAAGVELPSHDGVAQESADLGAALPTELRADLVLRFDHRGRAVLGAIVEVQLSIDADKLFSWPAYVTSLRARLRCPVLLVVVSVDRAVARWAGRPIAFGPRSGALRPLVLGPSELPVITDPAEAARSPELATLAALAHGRDEDIDRAVAIAGAAAEAVLGLADRRAAIYYDLILASLGEAARKALQMLPQHYVFQDPGMRQAHAEGKAEGKIEGKAEGKIEGKVEGKAEGKVEGKAEAVLLVLEARGLRPTEAERAHILACADDEVLVRWLRAAVSIEAVEQLFVN